MSTTEPIAQSGQQAVRSGLAAAVSGQRTGPQAAPVYERKTRLTVKDESLTLEIPPPGLDSRGVIRLAAFVAGGLVALLLAVLLPGGAVGWVVCVLSACGGLALLTKGAYEALRARQDAAVVCVRNGGIEVSHSFPSPHTQSIARSKYAGILIGRRGLFERGYTCQDWGPHGGELVVGDGKTRLHFGEGRPAAEQRWLIETIADRLPDPVPARPPVGVDLSVTQPPERFWRDITRYAVCALTGALVLLALLASAGASRASLGSVLALALFMAVVAALAYRSSGWRGHWAITTGRSSSMKPPSWT